MTEQTKIVVIGGSFAGITFIKTLEKLVAKSKTPPSITLIDKRNGALHNIGTPRALVEPGVAAKLVLKYDRIFQNITIIQGAVTQVLRNKVLLDNQQEVEFDYLLVATGTDYTAPAKSLKNNVDEIVADLETMLTKVQEAESILIVGGGPVGVEIAGEIATDYPEKKVTLIQRADVLVKGNFKEKFHRKLMEKVQAKGIEVILGDSVIVTPEERRVGYHSGTRTLITEKGKKEITSDLQIYAVGNMQYNTQLLNGLGDGLIDVTSGRINVRPTLQLIPDNLGHIFIAGDIANVDQNVLAFIAKQQGELAAKNVHTLLSGKGKLASVKPSREAIGMVTVGRRGGQGQLPFGVVGDFMTRMFKAKDMLVGSFQANTV